MLVAGGGHDESDAVEIRRLERPGPQVGDRRDVDVLAHVRCDEAHTSAGGREALCFAGTDSTSSDNEDVHVVEVEEDRIGERRRRFEGHFGSVRNQFPTKLICLVGI